MFKSILKFPLTGKGEMGKFPLGPSHEFIWLAKSYDFLLTSLRGQKVESNSQVIDLWYTYSQEQSDPDSILKINLEH